MSNLLKEWNRLAFGKRGRSLNESWDIDQDPRLKPLEEYGSYFAGAETVVLGDLDDMSGKKFRHSYPYDEYMGQGPFHVQVSVDDNGMFTIHDYSSVEDVYCTGSLPKKGQKYSDLKEVSYAINEMIKCYEEFMDAYCQIRDAGGTLDAEEDYVPAYINADHPAAQALRKK